MTDKKPITLSEHMSRAAKARHAKRTPEERSAHAKRMVEAREAKRAVMKAVQKIPIIYGTKQLSPDAALVPSDPHTAGS